MTAFRTITLFFCIVISVHAGQYEKKVSVLYDSLDPNSLTELFAFYHLYSETSFGTKAFTRAWNLINKHRSDQLLPLSELDVPRFDIEALISLATKQSYEGIITLSEKQLELIDQTCSHLKNRNLKGHDAWDLNVVANLSKDDIDLSRAILLYQFGPEKKNEIRNCEAYLDMMALQILARLPKHPSDTQILEAINTFIFHEMRYRFPPHSMWAKDVDLYTFLSSVLDSRHGVCLGVSTLILNLAQRLGLTLEIITPPGHIYLRYHKGEKLINIETTARGIDMPDETYLGINTRALKERNIKEVVGLNFLNAAATAWHKNDSAKAIELYTTAMIFMPNDPLVQTFMGYNLLFQGRVEEGKKMLTSAIENPAPESIYGDAITEDFLNGKINPAGIAAIFQEVDETRESILEKQKEIKSILENYPEFREGIFHLAITYLQLNRAKEALEVLERYHKLEPNNPTAEYYLAALCKQRYQYKNAYQYLKQCNEICQKKNHMPKALLSLKESLRKEALPPASYYP